METLKYLPTGDPKQWNALLTNDCRVDIVRTLVTLVTSKVGPKPSKSQLEQVVLEKPLTVYLANLLVL